jgi:hypothetical protein
MQGSGHAGADFTRLDAARSVPGTRPGGTPVTRIPVAAIESGCCQT